MASVYTGNSVWCSKWTAIDSKYRWLCWPYKFKVESAVHLVSF